MATQQEIEMQLEQRQMQQAIRELEEMDEDIQEAERKRTVTFAQASGDFQNAAREDEPEPDYYGAGGLYQPKVEGKHAFQNRSGFFFNRNMCYVDMCCLERSTHICRFWHRRHPVLVVVEIVCLLRTD